MASHPTSRHMAGWGVRRAIRARAELASAERWLTHHTTPAGLLDTLALAKTAVADFHTQVVAYRDTLPHAT